MRAEPMFFRKRKRAERPSVDWMDFGREDGGPIRRMVDLGIHEVASWREAPLDAMGGETGQPR